MLIIKLWKEEIPESKVITVGTDSVKPLFINVSPKLSLIGIELNHLGK